MKNKILKLTVVIVIAVMAVFNLGLVSKSSDLSDVSLANVEALAYELPEVVISCGRYSGQCYIEMGTLCYIGEYTRFRCLFVGATWASCYSPC